MLPDNRRIPPAFEDGSVYPPETQTLIATHPWWAQAVHEWETRLSKGRASRWLPRGFDPYAVCSVPLCADPWCHLAGKPEHDRQRPPLAASDVYSRPGPACDGPGVAETTFAADIAVVIELDSEHRELVAAGVS